MATSAGIRVEGARQLRSSLKKASGDLGALKGAHAEVAGLVSRKAQPEAPVRSGRLASTVRPGATNRAAIVRAGRASVPYAGVQEFGWPARNIGAQPFITTTAASTEPEWTAVYEGAVQSVLNTIRGT